MKYSGFKRTAANSAESTEMLGVDSFHLSLCVSFIGVIKTLIYND